MTNFLIPIFGKDLEIVPFFEYHFSGAGVFLAMLTILLIASTMAPFVTLLSEKKYTLSSKAIHEKYSWQMLQSSLVLAGIATVVLIIAYSLYLFHVRTVAPEVPLSEWLRKVPAYESVSVFSIISETSLASFYAVATIALTLLLFLLLAVCLGIWKKRRTIKTVRIIALLPAVIIGFFTHITYYIFFFFIFRSIPIWDMYFLPVLEKELPEITTAIFAGALALTPLLWLTSIGAMVASIASSVWLILRRTKADFGRDYYTFAMHSSVRFALKALIFATLCILIFIALFAITNPMLFSTNAFCATFFVVLLISVICGILLRNVSHSQTPMRHKISIMCALLCSIPLVLIHSASFLLIIKPFLK